MTIKTAKTIFYIGTLSSTILFLLLTLDTQRQIGALTHADRISNEVVAGKKAFQKYNCNDCHTILGFGAYYAPDLTKVYQRRGELYIRDIVTNPEKILSNSFRKMPQQYVTPEETENLIAFFRWTNGIDTHNWPPQDSKSRPSTAVEKLVGSSALSRGAALFKENKCFSCHKLQGVGGTVGPDLNHIGDKLNLEDIQKQIANPQSLKPDAKMPPYSDLSSQDIKDIAEFLVKQEDEPSEGGKE